MQVIARTVVGFAAMRSRSEFVGERAGPLFPREMAVGRQSYRKREGLRLPWFGEDRFTAVSR